MHENVPASELKICVFLNPSAVSFAFLIFLKTPQYLIDSIQRLKLVARDSVVEDWPFLVQDVFPRPKTQQNLHVQSVVGFNSDSKLDFHPLN